MDRLVDYDKVNLYYSNKLRYLQLELQDLNSNLLLAAQSEEQANPSKSMELIEKLMKKEQFVNPSRTLKLPKKDNWKFMNNHSITQTSSVNKLSDQLMSLKVNIEKYENKLRRMIYQKKNEKSLIKSNKLDQYVVALDEFKKIKQMLEEHSMPLELMGKDEYLLVRKLVEESFRLEDNFQRLALHHGPIKIREIVYKCKNYKPGCDTILFQIKKEIPNKLYIDEMEKNNEIMIKNNEFKGQCDLVLEAIVHNNSDQKEMMDKLDLLRRQYHSYPAMFKPNQSLNSISTNTNNSNKVKTKKKSRSKTSPYAQSLFNSVWNNIRLKKLILGFLTYYNYFSIDIQFNSIREWHLFQYKQYLKQVTFTFPISWDTIPDHLDSVKIIAPQIYSSKIDQIPYVPKWVKSLGLSLQYPGLKSSSFGSISSRLTSLYLYSRDFIIPELESNVLPSTLRELNIDGLYNHGIKKNVLPNNLCKLTIYNIDSIEDGAIPKSLYYLDIKYIHPNLISKFPSNGLVYMKITNPKFNYHYNQRTTFPSSLKTLEISSCSYFNSTLPSGLKTFKLIAKRYANDIIYPSSLETLYIKFMKCINVKYKSKLPASLKSLHISCNSLISQDNLTILPEGLQYLTFINGFNSVILKNQIPSTLIYLDLGDYFNQRIDEYVLPSNLHTLILGRFYKYPLVPLAVPQTLRILEYRYLYYKLDYIQIYNPYLKIKNHQFINKYFSCQSFPCLLRNMVTPEILVSDPLSTIDFTRYKLLEILDLGTYNKDVNINHIQSSTNVIDTIELNYNFNQTINLNSFKHLKTIILPLIKNSMPKLIIPKDRYNNQIHIFENIIIQFQLHKNYNHNNNNNENNNHTIKCNILKDIDIDLLKLIKIQY